MIRLELPPGSIVVLDRCCYEYRGFTELLADRVVLQAIEQNLRINTFVGTALQQRGHNRYFVWIAG